MISSIGFENRSNTQMKFFSKFKKNNSDYEKEKVEDDLVNGIPSHRVIKMNNLRYLDITKMGPNEEKIIFIRNNIELLKYGYKGFVVQKNINSKTFLNDHSYNKNAFLLNGLVIINKLSESVYHGRVVFEMNELISIYCRAQGHITGSGSSDLVIDENTVYNPDGSYESVPSQYPRRVLLIFEVNYKAQTKTQSFNKCTDYFDTDVNIVFLLQLWPLGVSNLKKFCLVVFDGSVSIVNPSAIISFGSEGFTARDINKYRRLSNQQTPITGFLHNNNTPNNTPNNPIFTITIQPNSLFFPNPPANARPLTIDLYALKQRIDLIPIPYLN
ncbi:hypothetical protein DDB_G0270600 [Dictyostelium discoideum AX4]|uniref:Uncharacterized protein n=1 Tax=Dictyostelium discoideum TaxID=44689 RepID=C7FZW6_DICDI|nr:hypothetical protein DDB_G0270600 [Dictyostelium discoideum AX4]EEU04147.1 hypothetical protein DDB_G0270600 [Dictyostelium discoideum AX4]|eukprot:XP_002649197.1 hypothetical protein DDB_G0270600 [Dictyostelium discoideum AX4]